MKTIFKELVAPDGKRKVQVFRRDDGSFGFESLRFSEEPLEMNGFLMTDSQSASLRARTMMANKQLQPIAFGGG